MSAQGFTRAGTDRDSLRSLAKVAIDVAETAGAEQRVVATMRKILRLLSQE